MKEEELDVGEMQFTLLRFKSYEVVSLQKYKSFSAMLCSPDEENHKLVDTFIDANWGTFQEKVRQRNNTFFQHGIRRHQDQTKGNFRRD